MANILRSKHGGSSSYKEGHTTTKPLLVSTTPPRSKSTGRNYEDHESSGHHHHGRTWLMAKMVNKAKKWKHAIVNKQQRGNNNTKDCHCKFHRFEAQGQTSVGLASLVKEQEQPTADEKMEYHTGFQKAPVAVYETEKKSHMYKGKDVAEPLIDKGVNLNTNRHQEHEEGEQYYNAQQSNNDVTVIRSIAGMLAPAISMVSEAAKMVASTITSRTEDPQLPAHLKEKLEIHDKEVVTNQCGVSVKEFLAQKPGDSDRALSELITEALSPRKLASQSKDSQKKEKPSSSLFTREEHALPISTNPHIEEFYVQERRLQTN